MPPKSGFYGPKLFIGIRNKNKKRLAEKIFLLKIFYFATSFSNKTER